MRLKQQVTALTVTMTAPRLRVLWLTLYYLAILLGLILLYGRGDFSTPPFVYQGF
jgi:hypothetical protein